MGLAGIGITQLLIVLLIVVLLFGTKKLKQAGWDVGGMIRGVRDGFGGDGADLKDIAKEVAETRDELAGAAKEFTHGER